MNEAVTMPSFWETNSFWALVSLILFFAVLVYYNVPPMVSNALNKRARRIARELEEARGLREEAQKLLAEYQKKRHEAEQEAEEIIASAKRQADDIVDEMRQKTAAYIDGRRKMAEQRIARAESDAVNFIRSASAEKAIAAAGKVMEDKVKSDAAEGARLFDNAVTDLKAKFKKAS